jgi:VanZ family protein
VNLTIRWLPCLIWMVFIFVMSSRTGDDLGSILPFFQYLFPSMRSFDWGHFAAYFVLALTYLWALTDTSATWALKLTAVALCVVYGLTDEYHQRFVAGRTPDWMDIRNDGIGAALAIGFVSIPAVGRLYEKLSAAKKY